MFIQSTLQSDSRRHLEDARLTARRGNRRRPTTSGRPGDYTDVPGYLTGSDPAGQVGTRYTADRLFHSTSSDDSDNDHVDRSRYRVILFSWCQRSRVTVACGTASTFSNRLVTRGWQRTNAILLLPARRHRYGAKREEELSVSHSETSSK